MAVQVITRDYGYVAISQGDSWSVSDNGILNVRDEGGETVAAFIQWIGAIKPED